MLQEMLDFATAPRVFISPETFERLAAENDLLRLERTADGRLIVLPPCGLEGGGRESSLGAQLYEWNRQTRLGRTFSSNAGYTLPNGAVRAPDASWISTPRWAAVPVEDKRRFAHIVPDFAIELLSESDSLREIREKAREYVGNGVRLVWVIDPSTRSVEIYRPGYAPQRVENRKVLSAEPELPGFELDLEPIFEDG